MGNVPVLFIHARMHEAHKPFIEAVNADVYSVYWKNVEWFRRFFKALTSQIICRKMR
jgi:hypothetical protein